MGRGWEGGMDRVGESGGGKMKTTVFEHQEKKKMGRGPEQTLLLIQHTNG